MKSTAAWGSLRGISRPMSSPRGMTQIRRESVKSVSPTMAHSIPPTSSPGALGARWKKMAIVRTSWRVMGTTANVCSCRFTARRRT